MILEENIILKSIISFYQKGYEEFVTDYFWNKQFRNEMEKYLIELKLKKKKIIDTLK